MIKQWLVIIEYLMFKNYGIIQNGDKWFQKYQWGENFWFNEITYFTSRNELEVNFEPSLIIRKKRLIIIGSFGAQNWKFRCYSKETLNSLHILRGDQQNHVLCIKVERFTVKINFTGYISFFRHIDQKLRIIFVCIFICRIR